MGLDFLMIDIMKDKNKEYIKEIIINKTKTFLKNTLYKSIEKPLTYLTGYEFVRCIASLLEIPIDYFLKFLVKHGKTVYQCFGYESTRELAGEILDIDSKEAYLFFIDEARISEDIEKNFRNNPNKGSQIHNLEIQEYDKNKHGNDEPWVEGDQIFVDTSENPTFGSKYNTFGIRGDMASRIMVARIARDVFIKLKKSLEQEYHIK